MRDMRLVLTETGIDPRRVVCEVTEQKIGLAGSAVRASSAALRANGFRIAVDDYGADDSDMDRIKELRPDIVKFDARLDTRLMDTGPGFALLSAMVSTFAEQGIRTVFEGIEEGWQLELAEKSGASMVQGFVLARPELAPTEFLRFRAGRHAGRQAQHCPGPRTRRQSRARSASCASEGVRPPGAAP